MARSAGDVFARLGLPADKAEIARSDHEEFLEHYGVKGMRWGVRRELKGIRGASNRTEFLKKRDAAWMDKVSANPKLEKISRMVAKDAKSAIKELNRAYPKKFGLRNKSDQARYDRALEETISASIDRAAYKTHKLSPTRAHEVKLTRTESGELLAKVSRRTNPKIIKTEAKLNRMDERAKKKAIAHAEEDLSIEDFEGLGFLLLEDADGLVVDVVTPFDDLEHSEQVEEFLAHYGVKGMRWGVRKRSSESSDNTSSGSKKYKVNKDGSVDVPVTRNSATGKDVAVTPKGKPASDDAATKYIVNARINALGLDAVTNTELKAFNERLNLERSYRDAMAKQPTAFDRGHKQLKKMVSFGKTASEAYALVNSPAGKSLRSVLDSNAKAAGKASLAVAGLTAASVGKHRR